MKIIIEPETEEEKKNNKRIELENVFEFAIAGRGIHKKIQEYSIQHIHINDKLILLGRIRELEERLKTYGT